MYHPHLSLTWSFSLITLANNPIAALQSEVVDPSGIKMAQAHLLLKLDEAITQFESISLNKWAYQVERVENEEGTITQSIERYDPVNGPGNAWSLVQLNEQIPSQKQREAFAKRQNGRIDSAEEINVSLRLRELIQLDTIQRVAEDPTYIYATFDVYFSQLGEEDSKQLQGTLKYAKVDDYIEHITIVNTAPLAPVFTAKITDLQLNLSFTKMQQAVLPQQIELSMQGTFAIFTEINEVSRDTFSQFQYRGKPLPIK